MFQFAWPWVFFLFPLPWIARLIMPPAVIQETTALRVPFFSYIQKLAAQPRPRHETFNKKKYLVFAIWCLLLLAAAGPQWIGDPINLPRTGRDIMLAVDLSGSMQIPDMSVSGKKVDRLDVVKKVAGKFIKRREGDRLGLVLFGTKAYLQTPLTFDRKTTLAMLDDATIGLAGPETAIGDALGLATKRLMKRSKESRVIILLTDGASNTGTLRPIKAAELAKKAGIRIYTIGIGADKLMISGLLGPEMVNPSADLDENALKKIAKITGGEFFRAKNSKALENVYEKLDQLEPISAEPGVFRPTEQLYPWPLTIALLLAQWLTMRKLSWGTLYDAA